jgi:phytoene synthase
MRQWTRSESYAYCERLARRAAGNFYHAFRVLPAEQRRAMCALYAFLRIADDLSDEPGPVEAKRLALGEWRAALQASLEGDYRHPIYPALHHALTRFAVPARHLEATLDGVCLDLDKATYDTFAELYHYCTLVASAVGLACIRIWGHAGGDDPPAATAAGVALQLTNVLRDVGEDAARGRVYLPREDLDRFGCSTAVLLNGPCDDRFRALMRFQADRAARFYDEAVPLVGQLPAPGRAVFLVILRTYRALLDRIVQRDFDVFAGRVRLSAWHKLWLAARAVPVRWGLLPS